MAQRIDAQPIALDLNLYAGDDFSMLLTFTEANGLPWDASGIWAAQVRATPSSTEILADFTVDMTQAATGKVRLSLTGDQVRTIPTTGSSMWDAERTAGGLTRTFYRGKVTVTQDVTVVVG